MIAQPFILCNICTERYVDSFQKILEGKIFIFNKAVFRENMPNTCVIRGFKYRLVDRQKRLLGHQIRLISQQKILYQSNSSLSIRRVACTLTQKYRLIHGRLLRNFTVSLRTNFEESSLSSQFVIF